MHMYANVHKFVAHTSIQKRWFIGAQVFLVRVAELWLGGPRDVLYVSDGRFSWRRHMFRGHQAAIGDIYGDDVGENVGVNTTMYFDTQSLNVTFVTDEVRAAKSFRLELSAFNRVGALRSLSSFHFLVL